MWRSAVLHQYPKSIPFPKTENGEVLQYRTHATLKAYESSKKDSDLTCTFVRHPYTWWRSYFGRGREVDWAEHTMAHYQTPYFQQFIWNVLQFVPGWYSSFYCADRFVGRPGHEVDLILKYECMAECLLMALRLIRIEMDPAHVFDALPMNSSVKPDDIDGHLRQQLETAESYAMERYLYDKRDGDRTIQVRADLVEPCNSILADISKWALKNRGIDSNVIAVEKT